VVSSAGNPERAEAGWPPAVIAGAFQTGVLGVRSLVRRGVRAVCFDCNRDFPGFRSVYGPALHCPDPDVDPGAWLDFMISLSARMGGKPVLIPSADQFVSAIAAHADRLAEHYTVSRGIRLQGLLATKQTQYELADQFGMPLPLTRFVATEDDVTRFCEEARFPCLLKPFHFREWQAFPDRHPLSHQKVAIATSADALQDHWRLASAVNRHAVAQEIIQGPDTAKRVYVACYDGESRRIANAMFRELRCDPIEFGPASVSEPVVDPETDAVCDRFLQRLGYSGICEIEMKWDSRDNRVKLIEANPRLTGGGDAAPYAGVDVCWLHYLDMIGRRVTPVSADGRDFRHIVLRADVRAVLAYRQAGRISWSEVVRSYRSPRAYYDWDPRDWRYSLETVYLMARSLVGILLRRITGLLSREKPGHMV
jgi:D-aspartate ligase